MSLKGQEEGVDWVWSQNLDITVKFEDTSYYCRAHDVHDAHVAALSGNDFYGSFTLMSKKWNSRGTEHFHAQPTLAQHTEPQYFEWLAKTLSQQKNSDLAASFALVLEIAQTNTPCSSDTCRKAILAACSTNTVGDHRFPIVIARMSSHAIYYAQYPRVCPTLDEIKIGKKNMQDMWNFERSGCIHRFPSG